VTAGITGATRVYLILEFLGLGGHQPG